MNATFLGIALTERETAALAVLEGLVSPTTGDYLASKMSDAGLDTPPAGAHRTGASLTRKGLATKGHLPGGSAIRYEITRTGRDWFAQYRRMGGRA